MSQSFAGDGELETPVIQNWEKDEKLKDKIRNIDNSNRILYLLNQMVLYINLTIIF